MAVEKLSNKLLLFLYSASIVNATLSNTDTYNLRCPPLTVSPTSGPSKDKDPVISCAEAAGR